MGFFDRIKDSYDTIKYAKGKLDYLRQFPYLPDAGSFELVGKWMLCRDQTGNPLWYVTEGEKPFYVEQRTEGSNGREYAFVCSYFTDKKGDSDPRYVIARGTLDGLEAWFKVNEDFYSEYLTIGENKTALFFDEGNEKLHIIEPEGTHRTKTVGDYHDCAGNTEGFFWWVDNGDNIEVKGYAVTLSKSISKKVKAPNDEYESLDTALCEDGIHIKFQHYEDNTSIREFVCDFQGNVSEI